MTNPLIDPFRKAGQDYIDSFKGDDKAMLEDLRKRSQGYGNRLVKLPPKPPRTRSASSNSK